MIRGQVPTLAPSGFISLGRAVKCHNFSAFPLKTGARPQEPICQVRCFFFFLLFIVEGVFGKRQKQCSPPPRRRNNITHTTKGIVIIKDITYNEPNEANSERLDITQIKRIVSALERVAVVQDSLDSSLGWSSGVSARKNGTGKENDMRVGLRFTLIQHTYTVLSTAFTFTAPTAGFSANFTELF